MRKKRNDFDAVGVERMTDAELSKKLGGYQRTESISISLGVLLVIAGCISMFIQHDPIFCLLYTSPIGAGIPTSASGMSRNLRAFGTMTATSRLRPISSSTVMETGAITSALPALSLRKWTAEFSPTPWTR